MKKFQIPIRLRRIKSQINSKFPKITKTQLTEFKYLNLIIIWYLAFGIWILDINVSFAANAASENITVHFFYSPDCGHCMDILLEDIPRLQNLYQFNFKKYDLNNLDNYKLLEQLEKEKNIKNIGEDLPIVFTGDSAFYGPDEVKKKLEGTIKKYTGVKKFIIKNTNEIKPDTVKVRTEQIYLYYFYQPACRECHRAEILLNGLSGKYPNIRIYRYNIIDDTSKIFYEGLAEIKKVPEKNRLIVPAIFIGNDYLIKDFNSSKIESLLVKYSSRSPRLDTLKLSFGERSIFERFSRFSILGVIFAGLLDGVNPCAFATIIFFVSYLLFIGRKRKTIIVMSISFITAVFLCYLAIGLGAYIILNLLATIKIIGQIIFISFGIFAIVLGTLSLYDYFVARAGDTNKMILQLPLIIKQRIHKEIKEKTSIRGIIIGSFIAGILISFLEFGCTGQVYLPTITFVVSRTNLAIKPIILLIIYNIMFIIPLIIIAIAANIISRENVAQALSKKIPLVKLFTALLFFLLGILLILF